MEGNPSRGVIVVGGSPIGTAIGRAFAADGDTPFCIARDEPLPGAFAGWYPADCADRAQADEAVEAALAVLSRLDVVVLAAASMPIASLARTTEEQWHQALDDGLTSAFHILRAAIPRLPRGGSIVAVGSTNSFLAAPGLAAYAAAKAGLDGLIRQVALDYGRRGVRANVVAPGLVSDDAPGAFAAGYPLERVARTDDVANAVVFLASPRASFITGVTLPVDGGLSIASPAAFLRDDLRRRLDEV